LQLHRDREHQQDRCAESAHHGEWNDVLGIVFHWNPAFELPLEKTVDLGTVRRNSKYFLALPCVFQSPVGLERGTVFGMLRYASGVG
jgi:hypothetical protein